MSGRLEGNLSSKKMRKAGGDVINAWDVIDMNGANLSLLNDGDGAAPPRITYICRLKLAPLGCDMKWERSLSPYANSPHNAR